MGARQPNTKYKAQSRYGYAPRSFRTAVMNRSTSSRCFLWPLGFMTQWLSLALLCSMFGVACSRAQKAASGSAINPEAGMIDGPSSAETSSPWKESRHALIDTIRQAGIADERVLAAMRQIPRHELVPALHQQHAYSDTPLPIGYGQTISQPYVVALMTELADVGSEERVLEIGTGSGYQTAVLAKLAKEVYTIEIVEPLGLRAERDLQRLGLAANVQFRVGDGYAGWPEAAPFDAIIVTAAPPHVPMPLKQQLAVGGRLVIPVGDRIQMLRTLVKRPAGFEERPAVSVRFVPMTGEAQKPD